MSVPLVSLSLSVPHLRISFDLITPYFLTHPFLKPPDLRTYSNDFTFYDHVLDMSVLLGNIPAKYATAAKEHQLSTLDVMFAMGRGRQRDGVDVEASESGSNQPPRINLLIAN